MEQLKMQSKKDERNILLAEDLRLPKSQETPQVPGYGKRKQKKQRQKNRDGTYTSGREL